MGNNDNRNNNRKSMVTDHHGRSISRLCYPISIKKYMSHRLPTVTMQLLSVVVAALASVSCAQSAEQSCFPVVGCFSNDAPWTSATRAAPPPMHPANISTTMTLYTTDLPAGKVVPIFPEIDLNGVQMDKEKPTFVIFHGYGASNSTPWVLSVKDSMIRRTGGNVLVASWGELNVPYDQSASNARVAAKLAAMALDTMQLDPENMHIIAHCVGSHVAGYTAKLLNQSSGKKLARLTALNPAAPLFKDQPNEVRLNIDDADFIDAMHSEIIFSGVAQPIGHVDFYFNSPAGQPGCDPTPPKTYGTCSHSQIEKYIPEIMADDCMRGQPADLVMNKSGGVDDIRLSPQNSKTDDYLPVGLSTPTTARGVFVVFTNAQEPFCQAVATGANP